MKAKKWFQKYWFWVCMVVIITVAAILRLKCCFHGYPLQLHSDERAIVNWVIEMLKRHSWEAHSYDRPDHFEIKCNAIIFSIFSWLRFHQPAYEAFQEHMMAFFILARMYTSFFGVALIPLTSLYAGKLANALEEKYQRLIQLIVALLIAFSALFVEHSAYASPDIVLTFFVLLFAYQMINYLENGNTKSLYLCMIIIGVSLTIKYPAAILCIPLAGMVIYRSLKIDKKPILILKYGLISVGVILFTVFVLAPNLFTDFPTVYKNFLEEARPTHLGADGLGFFGNLKFYFESITDNIGTVTYIPFAVGLCYVFTHRDSKWLSLLVAVFFWLCLSCLALHWVRWGIPMYPFFIIIVAIGFGTSLQWLDQHLSSKNIKHLCKSATIAFACTILLSVILSGFARTKFSSLPDTRYTSMQFLEDNGITEENSISEGYTPFLPAQVKQQYNAFVVTEEGVKPKIDYATKRYFIMSNSFKDRYLAAEERYPNQCQIYRGIDETYEIVYQEIPDGNYTVDHRLFENIRNTWHYLRSPCYSTGEIITVYDMKTPYVTIASKSGAYLSATGSQESDPIVLADQEDRWVIYDNENATKTLLSADYGLPLDSADAKNALEGGLMLKEATGDKEQQLQMIDQGDAVYFVFDNHMALTYDEGSVFLSEWRELENQRWIINIVS